MPIDEGAKNNLQTKFLLASSIIVLLVVRLVAWYNTAIISRDSILYVELARDWLSGMPSKALHHPYHPLYPILIALFSKVTGFSLEHSGVGVSIIASALTLPALVILFRNYNRKVVLFLALLFFCVSPYLVRYTADILTEPLYLCLVAWAAASFVLAVLSRKKRWGFFFLGGLFVGAAYLTRPEGLVVGVAGAIWLFFFYREVPIKKVAAALVFLMIGGVIVGAPYILYLHKDTGAWLLTRKKRVGTLISEMSHKKVVKKPSTPDISVDLPKGISKERAEFLRNRKRWQWEQADRIRQVLGEPKKPRVKPETSTAHFIFVLIESLGSIIIGFLKGMFFPIGIWVVFRFFSLKWYPWNRIDSFIVVFSVLYWVMLALLLSGYGYVSRRHYAAVAMFWFVWSAIGFTFVCDRIALVFKRKLVTPKTVGACLLIPVLGLSVFKGTKPYRLEKTGRKVVGRWIQKRKPKKGRCVVLTSMVRIGYYAGCRAIFLQTIGEEDVNALRRHEIAYVVLQKREMVASPVLMELLKKFGYREVYQYTSRIGHQDLHIFTYRGQN